MKCFKDKCQFLKQGENGMVCTHENAVKYVKLKKPCEVCGRKDGQTGGCGNCIGRGLYAYPNMYEDCDCGGYKLKE